MNPATAIALVFLGCCSNVIFLELIVREYPGSGNIVTFAQFFFIAIEGFIFTTNFGRKAPIIPIRTYFIMVCIFFFTSVINNYALNFDIPMPLHIIFRAGSLIANLVLGVIILNKRYPLTKYLSILMITAGIILATLASADTMNGHHKVEEHDVDSAHKYSRLTIGVVLLTAALLLSAYMGIYQETVYKQHGKHPSEALFYNHALPLPFFLLLSSDIYNHASLFSASEPLDMFPSVPKMWMFMLGNIVTQFMCIKSVFVLTTELSSLAVTLVVTLRKLVSLLFSILYFRNPFTAQHWLATVLVFTGTLLFLEVFSFGKTTAPTTASKAADKKAVGDQKEKTKKAVKEITKEKASKKVSEMTNGETVDSKKHLRKRGAKKIS